jgi:hypothetical protein
MPIATFKLIIIWSGISDHKLTQFRSLHFMLENTVKKKQLLEDNLVKVAGSRWMRAAQDRSSWRTLGEAYVQQWTCLG